MRATARVTKHETATRCTMIYFTNIWTLPVVLLALSIDMWLLACSIRLLLRQMPRTHDSHAYFLLQRYLDTVPARIGRWLASWRRRPTPEWLGWFLLLVSLFAMRHALIVVIFHLR